MSTPNDPQNPYGSPQEPGSSGEQPPQAPQYGSPQPPQYGAPQYGGSQYGPPPSASPYPAGGYQQPAGPPPNNYLVWAILSTVLCCLPLGIASIVFSTQVNSKWQMGDVAGAQASADKAKKFAIWSAIAGVVVGGIYLALVFAGVLSQSSTTGY
ncbi:CD225/dispanin family protein [Cellulomonas massiliensis]|uniref:CD225/dispanin family protein n=1 Tax=Cellulomonas massiliensis TaxID=1465811 RepID=UPI00030126C7|nr:CD225/dispanin family protein [Cellulomonas massiliensis]